MFEVHHLPIEFKIPEGVDIDKFMKKVYNLVIDYAENENIEVVSDCWYDYLRDEED